MVLLKGSCDLGWQLKIIGIIANVLASTVTCKVVFIRICGVGNMDFG